MTRRISIAALALCAACSSNEPGEAEPGPDVVCTLEARAGLVVTVRDAMTNENLAPEANVRVTDGDHSEMLDPIGGTYAGAYERPGTYTIVVSHPGHQQWQRAGVTVGRDECHVIPEHVEARLTPE